MKNIYSAFLLALGLAPAAPAIALPPPLPLSVTVVAIWPDDSPQMRHIDMLIDALQSDGWIKRLPAARDMTRDEKSACQYKGADAPLCLRALNKQAGAPAAGAAPHVFLHVHGETHRATITCIGAGDAPSNPAAQSRQIDIKAALFAASEARHPHRLAAASCLLAARAE